MKNNIKEMINDSKGKVKTLMNTIEDLLLENSINYTSNNSKTEFIVEDNKDVDKVISALDNTNLTNCALFIRKYNKNTYVRLRYN